MDLNVLSDEVLAAVLVDRGMHRTTAEFYAAHRDHEDMAVRIPQFVGDLPDPLPDPLPPWGPRDERGRLMTEEAE